MEAIRPKMKINLLAFVLIFNGYYVWAIGKVVVQIFAKEFQCYLCSSDKLEACSVGHQSNQTELPIQLCPSLVSSCFVKIENGITYRGCMSNDSDGVSLANSDNSKYFLCHSNNCNGYSVNSNISRKQCIRCKSKNDSKCIGDVDSSHSKACKQAEDQCFTHIGNYSVTRGCMSEQSLEFAQSCQKYTEKCSICNGNNCNNDSIALETCINCVSTNDTKCQEHLDSFKGKICSTVNSKDTLGCFLSTDPNFMWGCVRDLESEFKEHCLDQPDNCKTCMGNECNAMKQFQSCYFNNTEPVSSTTLLASDENATKICKKFDDKCFTLISENDVIIKDCLHDYVEKKNLSIDFLEMYNKSSYVVCSTPLCNNQDIRPMYCIACDSNNDRNCNSIPLANSTKCPLEIDSSGCFHYFDGQKDAQRGCIAELNETMRANCESDSNECKKCTGNECNSRLHFQKCILNNLKMHDLKQSKLCKRYTDECFIHVTNETVRRGCKSDVIDSPDIGIDLELDCRNETICEMCSSNDDCNNREVNNEQCIECASDGFGIYANSLHRLKFKNCPLALKKQGCYLFQQKSWKTQRGCMSQLNLHDRNNCSIGNGSCKMCLGDKCNQKETFQQCYACTTETDRDKCLSSPNHLNKITCSEYMGHCYTNVNMGLVTRGCTGDVTVPTVDECDRNPSNCKHCSSNQSCNVETIETITCVSCDSLENATCATNAPIEMIKSCPVFNLEPQRCYHFINKTSMQHIRGCVADLMDPIKDLCQDNRKSDECRTCIGSNCNKNPTFARCLHCDSALDPQCAINPHASSFSTVCTAYVDECYTFISKFNVSRGCVSEQKAHFKNEECKNLQKCTICSATGEFNCNNRTIVMETCIDCDTKKGENCLGDLNMFKGKVCSEIDSTDKEGCYLSRAKDHIVRGCVRDIDEQKKSECKKQSDWCKTCDGKDCNVKKSFQQCIDCDSKYNNECLGNKTTNWKQCENYLSTCLIGIDAHGFTHRSCSVDYEHDSLIFPNNQFVVCTENMCNNYIFPPNRLQCYECNGEPDCDFKPTNSTEPSIGPDRVLKPCNILSVFDQCYAYLSEHNHVYRGCLSDSTDHRLLCDQEQNRTHACIKCKEFGCNDVPKIRPSTLSCVHCSGSAECAFGFEKDSASPCKGKVQLGSTESCYTQQGNDNESIERGCTLDRKTHLTENDKKFETCNESGCNRNNVLYSNCIVCDNQIDNECYEVSIPKNMTKQCKGTYVYSKRGCYTLKINNTLTRGCIKDLDSDKYNFCQKQKDQCHLCLDDSCNTCTPGTSADSRSNGFLIALLASLTFSVSQIL